jgi:hypothetical protein
VIGTPSSITPNLGSLAPALTSSSPAGFTQVAIITAGSTTTAYMPYWH